MNRRLLLILILILVMLPSLYLAYLHTVDPFLYTPLANIAYAFSSGSLNQIGADQPVYDTILFTVSAFCNIAPLQLAYLPIGALIFPLCIYALARKIIESKTIPILILLYFAFDFSIYPGNYSVLAYSWVHPLFFIFILMYIMYSMSDKRNPSLIALILIIFTSIVFLHPTYVFWAISFAIALNVIIIISKAIRPSSLKLIPTPFLTICLFVIYFGFNQLYFGFYIHRVILVEPEMVSEQFFNLLKSFLGVSTQLAIPYQISVGAPTPVIGYAAFARTAILLFFILLGLIFSIKKYYRNHSKEFDSMFVLMIALLIAGMMHTIGYALYGHISMRFLVLVFPIIAIAILKRARLIRAKHLMVSLIIVLAFSQTISFIAIEPEVNSVDVQTSPSSDWLISHTQGGVVFLSDFSTSQMTRYYFSCVDRDVTQRFYSSDAFSQIVMGDNQISLAEFILVNNVVEYTSSVGWATFEPLRYYEVDIGDNVHVNKIFDDGIIYILKSDYYE